MSVNRTYMDFLKSCVLNDSHVIVDAMAADVTFGNIRKNYLVGILTSNGKISPCQRALVLSLSTKTITLHDAGRAAFFKVGDALYLKHSTDAEASLGLVTVVNTTDNKITYDGTGTPVEHDEVYVKNGAETPVGINMEDVSATDETQVNFSSYLLHGIVNSDLIPNYFPNAETLLPHIFFKARGV